MQQYDMERMFDEIYHKAIPLILFSFQDDRKVFADYLQSLYDAFYRNDEVSFNEIYEKLKGFISKRKSYGSHKENLIKGFNDRYLSLDQRLRNIDRIFLEFYDMENQIKRDHVRLNNLTKAVKRISPTINTIKRKMNNIENRKALSKSDEKVNTSNQATCIKKNIDESIEKSNTTKESKDNGNQGIHIICKNCGHDWFFKGGGTRATCSQCHKTYKVK